MSIRHPLNILNSSDINLNKVRKFAPKKAPNAIIQQESNELPNLNANNTVSDNHYLTDNKTGFCEEKSIPKTSTGSLIVQDDKLLESKNDTDKSKHFLIKYKYDKNRFFPLKI